MLIGGLVSSSSVYALYLNLYVLSWPSKDRNIYSCLYEYIFRSLDGHDSTSRYFGETGRDLKTRVKEYQRCFGNADESNAVFLHSRDTGHCINWN